MEKKSEKDVKAEAVGNDKDGKKEEVKVQGVDPPKAKADGNDKDGKKEEVNAQGVDPRQYEIMDRQRGCAWEPPKKCMIGANLH